MLQYLCQGIPNTSEGKIESRERTDKSDGLTNQATLRNEAYRTSKNLDARKGIYHFTHPYYSIEQEVLRLIDLQQDERLLDVGCGTGKLLLEVDRSLKGIQLFGIDLSSGVYQGAVDACQREGVAVAFETADVQSLPFSDSSFHKIVAMHMLYHVPNIYQAISELARVLKPRGVIAITANSGLNRQKLASLKSKAAAVMGREVFADPNQRFNLENGVSFLSAHFTDTRVVHFRSELQLPEPEPFLNYFDSLREFWQPRPTDQEWRRVMDVVFKSVSEEILADGMFRDETGFGVVIATKG